MLGVKEWPEAGCHSLTTRTGQERIIPYLLLASWRMYDKLGSEPLLLAHGSGKDAQAITLIAIDDDRGPCYGAAVSRNTITASLMAVIAALNRRWKIGA